LRIAGWTKLDAKGLWEAWLARFEGEEIAVATAVWCANRLVKASKSRHTKRKFYDIKDAWLRQQESTGRFVRRERSECWGCDGNGCDRCDWSGVYRERILYVHEFEIEGQRYCFHSYTRPKTLLEGTGEDLEKFGGNFTETEWAALALPLSGLVRMLSYVAAVKWRVERHYDDPHELTVIPQPTDIRHWWVGKDE
jgi:hypothetical protein